MKILLLSVQFKTTKKRVLNWKKKFSQKLIFLNFNILKVQNITYVNGKCQKCRSKLSACLYIYIYFIISNVCFLFFLDNYTNILLLLIFRIFFICFMFTSGTCISVNIAFAKYHQLKFGITK